MYGWTHGGRTEVYKCMDGHMAEGQKFINVWIDTWWKDRWMDGRMDITSISID